MGIWSVIRKFGLCILLGLGANPAFAQVNAEQVINIGRNVLSMDDYMLAIQYFNQAIKAKPYLSDPYYYRALAKLYLEDYIGTEQDCTLAIERNKFKSEAYKLRGFARQYLGKNREALEDYEVGLDYNPRDKFFLYYKSVAQTELKEYEQADSTFRCLIKMYPRFEDAYTARARSYILRGDTVAALDDLSLSLEMNKNQVNAWLMRADIFANQKDWEKAMTALDEVVRLDPQLPDLYLNRAYVRYNADDYFGAMSDYNYTIELEPGNTAAIFNRGLLRYEVRDMNRAIEDFTRVLQLDPENFHALYNRALISLESGRYRNALGDLSQIIKKYPRFYQAYYAIAQCQDRLGDRARAIQTMYKADEIVRNYVRAPKRNPLDRPAIQPGVANKKGEDKEGEESEIEVMERFNQLVTSNNADRTDMAYNEKFKGKVQDLSLNIEAQPPFGLSFMEQADKFSSSPYYSRAVDDLNRLKVIPSIYISNHPFVPSDSAAISDSFKKIEYYTREIEGGSKRPADYFARGILYTMLKNYGAAESDFNSALFLDPNFSSALFARGFLKILKSESSVRQAQRQENNGMPLLAPYADALEDFDEVLRLSPESEFAWYNKGVIYLKRQDFTSALQCFGEALKLNPDLGDSYYNRGFSYLMMGNKSLAVADLRKAGELGVLPSYNVLKKMK